MKKYSLILFALVVAIFSYLVWSSIRGENDIEQSGLKELNVQLQWFDGAQFAGFYYANSEGFFEDEGLKVNLISGGYSVDPIEVLLNGGADIAIATGDQVVISHFKNHDKKAKIKDIKAFGTVFNKSFACFMAKKGKIKDLKDIVGKKIGVYRAFDTENVLKALNQEKNLGIKFEDVLDAPQIDAFVNDEIDLFPSYIINEPIMMDIKGIEVDIIHPEEHGILFYSDTFITTEEYWNENKNREILRKFLRAAAKGWHETIKDPAKSNEIMFKSIKNMAADIDGENELAKLMEIIKHLGQGENKTLFLMDKQRWTNMERHLRNIGRIDSKEHSNDLYDFELVNSIIQ